MSIGLKISDRFLTYPKRFVIISPNSQSKLLKSRDVITKSETILSSVFCEKRIYVFYSNTYEMLAMFDVKLTLD
jgi:hypothetical protein